MAVKARSGFWLALLLAVAFSVRMAYWAERAGDPTTMALGPDDEYNHRVAQALLGVEGSDRELAGKPFFRPPGYPLFLAAVYAMGGNQAVVPLAQMALGLVNGALAFGLVRRWWGDRAGLWAAAILLFHGVLLVFEQKLLDPVLLITLILLLLLLACRPGADLSGALAFFSGMVLGCIAVVRTTYGLWVVPLGGWVARASGGGRRRWRHVLLLGAGMVLTIAPVTVRNLLAGRDVIIVSSNAGVNWALGNNENADGRLTSLIPGVGAFRSCYDYPELVRQLESQAGRPLRDSEVSRRLARIGWRFVGRHLARFAWLCLRRTLLFWGPVEVDHNDAVDLERRSSRVLRAVPGSWVLALSWAVVGVGVVGSRKGRLLSGTSMEKSFVLLLVVLVVTAFLPYAVFFVAAQYRVPLLSLLAVAAARGFDEVVEAVGRRDGARWSFWLGVWVVVWGAASVNVAGYVPDEAFWHARRGAAYTKLGWNEEALLEYERAAQLDPTRPSTYYLRGILLLRQREPEQALQMFIEGLRRDADGVCLPDVEHVGLLAGAALAREGRWGEAVVPYERELREHPSSVAAHNNLGNALLELGRVDEALAHFRRACELRPDDPLVRNNLGRCHARRREWQDAIREFREALRLNPNHAAAAENLRRVLAEVAGPGAPPEMH